MGRPGTWEKGQSGNPRGRPKKKRALTEILARGGSKTIEDCDGRRRSGKRVVARLLWQAATTGVVRFPDAEKAMIIPLSDWLGIIKFIYGHIDGPPKQALDVDLKTDGELRVVYIDDWRDKAPKAAPGTADSDARPGQVQVAGSGAAVAQDDDGDECSD